MQRIKWLQKKHEWNLLAKTKRLTCGQCRKFHTPQCTFYKYPVQASDKACPDFEPRRSREGRRSRKRERKEKQPRYTLDLYAPIPKIVKPCGFFGDVLTEACWLPYRDSKGEVVLRPSVIVAKPDGYDIVDFWLGNHNIKGTFPSMELQTLMSVKGVQMLESNAIIEPQDVDKKIEEAFKRHLAMPKAEMILCKRWIEGTFFYDVFQAYPIESILGVSESGKSRLCLLNLALCYHAEGLIDPTEASIFRAKEEDKVSLIVDEAEYLNHPHLYATLRILINASYSKYSGYVTRYDEMDGKRVKRRFDLYSPMCVSGIAGLEGVTLSRAFRIVMRRVKKDFPKATPTMYNALRDMLYVLRIRHAFEVHKLYQQTDISSIVSARFEELFRPIFTMTKFFGTQEEWEILAEWCREYEENFRVEALNVAQEEMILVSLSKLTPIQGQPDWYSLKELAEKVNLEYNRKLSSKTVSNILYRLGITRRKKVKGYTLFYAPPELIEECAKRIGLPSESLQPLQSLPAPEEEEKVSENWLQGAKEIEQA
ncbi:hypothetical protein DRO19_01010 [Candidatus Bathyarchaeota archaeon]|nr:MAG: hypothetical protein DRO19_01010 [Candidatus Bathyarchaeota archaeon]